MRPPLVPTLIAGGSRALGGAIERLGDLQRVLNFARGTLEFEVRPDDIFISSYPRSGTTWMQFILYQLAGAGSMSFGHISQVVPWFERSLAVGALSAADLEALPSPRIFKSHLPYRWLPRGARYIYVVRDGRDVAVSYYHFYCSHLRYGGGFERFYRQFLGGQVQYKSWFKHVAAWEARRGNPAVLIVRYEELKRSLPAVVDEVARFLGIQLRGARRARVLERATFDFMKRHEDKFDFATEILLQSGHSGSGFLRGGRTGEWRDMLSAAQLEAFERCSRRRHRYPGLELDLPRFLH